MRTSGTPVVLFSLIAALSAPAPPAVAAELAKPYFVATPPGSWARYELSAKGVGKYTNTYTRRPDRDGKVEVEVMTEVLEGPGSGTTSTSRYLLEKGFDLSRSGLDFMSAIDEYVVVTAEAPAMAMPQETVTAIRESTSHYGSGFTVKGTRVDVEGHACDHYAYRAPSGGAAPTVDEGEIWLDPAVPFAIVRQEGTIKDAAGKVQSRYSLRLVGSGQGAAGTQAEAEPAVAGKPGLGAEAEAEEPSGPLGLLDAYQREKVKLHVEVVPASKGKRLRITLENKTDQALTVKVAKGKTLLPGGGVPLETLVVLSDADRTIEVPASGSAAPIEVGQGGDRGAVEGRFDLSVYEGTALFSGSITSDTLR